MIEIQSDIIKISDNLDRNSVPEFYSIVDKIKATPTSIDLSAVTRIDSSGVAFVDTIKEKYPDIVIIAGNERVKDALSVFSFTNPVDTSENTKENFFEKIGSRFFEIKDDITDLLFLASDIVFWSLHDLFSSKGQRKGAFTQQCILLGLDAVGIISLLSIILGFIMAVQSGNQLRQFGASVFLADMLSVTLVNELGPILTAIIIAGRSGSSIASELASMQVMEEIDALKIMAINPTRFVIVPKFHAITVCMPVLLLISIIVSLGAGLLVGVSFLGLSPITFFDRAIEILDVRDVLVSFVKTTFFAWVIVIIGSHMGLKVKGGAEGVGKATTDSVVTSIFAVIVLDALFSFIYLV